MLNLSYNLFDIRISSEKIYPSKNENWELKNRINKNFLYNDLSIDDLYKEGDSFPISEIQNPIDLNFLEHNNISSMNTTNEYKIFDCFDYVKPLFEKENNNNNIKEKIFEIKKTNKRLGRLKKNSFLKGKHNKFAEDNIIRKLKRRFLEKVRIYINNEYNNYCIEKRKTKGKKNWLKKIEAKFSINMKKTDNLNWFNLKIYEVFSENLSSKYSTYDSCVNKKKIRNFFLLKDSNKVKDILNMTIDTLFNKFINNEKLDSFKTLNDDMIELEKQMNKLEQENTKKYLDIYERTAKNLKAIFMRKTERNSKKH